MSSNEEAQIAQRRANLAAIVALGFRPYPNRFTTTHTVSALVAAHSASESAELEASRVDTVTAGRIVSIRNFGKAAFVVLSDGRSRIQVYVRQDSLSAREYDLSKLLDFGDQIGVAGHLFRTKTNELSIWATSLTFLAKCFIPLPEKWHGLQDVEIRYRQRYLDLIVNPDVRRVFEIRSRTVAAVRDFLTGHGFLEVETPMMQPIAGGALARPFVTHHNALDMKLYLRVAPELYLKRLTVGGIERVFEINRNFRNEGISTQHNPEFTMLEFYWAYVDYQVLMKFTEELLSFVARAAAGTEQVPFGDHTINLQAPFRRLSLREAAAEEASRRLGVPVLAEELRSRDSVTALAGKLGIAVAPASGAGKIATDLFEHLWQDQLVQPTFVYDFPTEISPLSKQKEDDPETVERFELYIGGFEVANAFSELNDPAEQRRRFESQLAERAKGDAEAHAMDEDYVRALEYGMPPAGGEGIGIDRLVMILSNSPSIRDVILFPHMRPPRLTMPYELQIALRYLLAKRRQVFISVISLVSTIGVTVGVMALIIALALMTGLQNELRDRILGSSAHVYVWKPSGMTDYRAEVQKMKAIPGVLGAAPALIGKALVTSDRGEGFISVKGIDPQLETEVTDIARSMTAGSVDDLRPATEDGFAGILIGKDLSGSLGAFPGDVITLVTPQGSLSPMGLMPRQRRMQIAGTFRLGLYEFDHAYGFVDLETAYLLTGEDKPDHLEIRVADIYNAPAVADAIQERLGSDYITQDWSDMNRSLYSALWLEKIAMGIGIGLIVMVAALNIVASLVLLVMEKTRDIAILKTMGASARSVMLIFLLQGMIIGVVGTIIGATSGAAIAWALDRYRVISIPSDVYQVTYLPFKLLPFDAVTVVIGAVIVCFLATLYPSRQAAKLDPAQALRFE